MHLPFYDHGVDLHSAVVDRDEPAYLYLAGARVHVDDADAGAIGVQGDCPIGHGYSDGFRVGYLRIPSQLADGIVSDLIVRLHRLPPVARVSCRRLHIAQPRCTARITRSCRAIAATELVRCRNNLAGQRLRGGRQRGWRLQDGWTIWAYIGSELPCREFRQVARTLGAVQPSETPYQNQGHGQGEHHAGVDGQLGHRAGQRQPASHK
jgi:hypothetical protein